MSTVHEEMSADFMAVHRDMPDCIELGKDSLAALVSDGARSAELELAGFAPVRTLTVRVLRQHLRSSPQVGELLTHANIPYRITSVSEKPTTPIITLECQQA